MAAISFKSLSTSLTLAVSLWTGVEGAEARRSDRADAARSDGFHGGVTSDEVEKICAAITLFLLAMSCKCLDHLAQLSSR